MNSRTTDVLLGLLFFAALFGLGFVTVALSDLQFGKQRFDIDLYSRDVGYLRPGDPILLYGMPSGKVLEMERLPEAREIELPEGGLVECWVLVHARVEADVRSMLPADSRIIIEDRGLLGGKLIRIDAGRSQTLWPEDKPLVANLATSVFQEAGDVIAENRESLRRSLDNIAEASQRLTSGPGVLAMLLNDERVASDLRGFTEDARQVSSDLRQIGSDLAAGEGTLGKLLKDDQLHAELAAAVGDLADMTKTARNGEGALGKLIYDPKVAADIERLTASAADVTDRINRGEGTLGRLINDPELWDQANSFFGELSKVATDIREGDGLLAALIHDEELAQDFKTLMKKVLGAVEDARETSPVTGIGSFLFGTF